MEHGPPLGYTPNKQKSVLIVKPDLFDDAVNKFRGSGVKITKEGDKHLGVAIGTTDFREKFVKTQVDQWIAEIETLSDIAKAEPHAAYSAFIFGMKHKWNYVMRTVPNIKDLFRPLEATIRYHLLPALMGGHFLTDCERAVFALPPRLGGLGIPNAVRLAESEHQNSKQLTSKLTQRIVAQDESGEIDLAEQMTITREISKTRERQQKEDLEGVKYLFFANVMKSSQVKFDEEKIYEIFATEISPK